MKFVPDELIEAFHKVVNHDCTLTMSYGEWKTLYAAAVRHCETLNDNSESDRIHSLLTRFEGQLNATNPEFINVSATIERRAESEDN